MDYQTKLNFKHARDINNVLTIKIVQFTKRMFSINAYYNSTIILNSYVNFIIHVFQNYTSIRNTIKNPPKNKYVPENLIH